MPTNVASNKELKYRQIYLVLKLGLLGLELLLSITLLTTSILLYSNIKARNTILEVTTIVNAFIIEENFNKLTIY